MCLCIQACRCTRVQRLASEVASVCSYVCISRVIYKGHCIGQRAACTAFQFENHSDVCKELNLAMPVYKYNTFCTRRTVRPAFSDCCVELHIPYFMVNHRLIAGLYTVKTSNVTNISQQTCLCLCFQTIRLVINCARATEMYSLFQMY